MKFNNEIIFWIRIIQSAEMNQKNNNAKYLDVSQFVMKEHSPIFKPRAIEEPIEINNQTYDPTHEISPILDAKMNFAMTPIFGRNKPDPFKQLSVDELESFSLDGHFLQTKGKRLRKGRPRLPSSWYIVENELDGIIQQNDSEDHQLRYSSQESDYQNQDSQIFDDNDQQSEQEGQQIENQKQDNNSFEVSIYQFKCPEWQAPNPKKDLVNRLKAILTDNQISTYQQKVNCAKQALSKYLCEYEKFYFQQSMISLQKEQKTIQDIISTLTKGIQQTFKRQIKGLSFQKRRLKLLRYLDKKKRRVWRKKVSYDCRKKVADGRLRIKGKFVTYQQACQQLGLASVEGYTPDQIKEMLYRKLQHS